MKFGHLFLLIIASILLLAAALLRPGWSPGVIENDLRAARTLDDQTRAWLTRQMKIRGIPGLSLAVVINGKVTAVEAIGVSDSWTRRSMTPDTLVEVASNSKVVTALGAVRDIRAGRLNLDRPLAEYRDDFDLEGEYADRITLEMLLTHTAGLDNALGRTPAANQHPDDQFRYSGVGFELVGSLIAHSASSGLPAALRASVLTPLGVSEQATWSRVGDSEILASPHMSITQPLILLVIPAAVVFTLLTTLVWLGGKLGFLKKQPRSLPLWILAASVLAAIALLFSMVSFGNAIRYLVADLSFLVAIFIAMTTTRRWRRKRSIAAGAISLVLLAGIIFAVLTHAPIPLQERSPGFPAAAGLRASAHDMGQLLAMLVSPPGGWEDDIAELTTPRVRVNAENNWGLGIGVQEIDGNRKIWHWGINYPGYQSLMLGDPATRSGLVILMNGGSLLISSSGPRWSGLELARELAGRLLPGPHGAYWHGVQ